MPFALLQHRLDIPDVEALRRAFRGVGGMTPADAPHIARDAFGILVRNMEHDDALALKSSLAREGVETEVVDHADLPEIPLGKVFRRVAIREVGFVGCDPSDRELVIPWDKLAVVSAGLVRETEFLRPRDPSPDPGETWEMGTLSTMNLLLGNRNWSASRFSDRLLASNPSTLSSAGQERQIWRWTADLVLAGGSVRFVLRADSLRYIDPIQHATGDAETVFLELIREIANRATSAALNRVAFALREGQSDTISYPSRNAYQEELLWLLWRLRQAGHGV